MRLTKQQWANCYFFFCYALARGRVAKLAAISTKGGWFPWHLVALTPQGHALHFCSSLSHEENRLAPWWFFGRVEGVRRSNLAKALQESGRSHCWTINSQLVAIGLAATVGLLFFLPWMVAWTLWPLAWFANSLRHAFYSRPTRRAAASQDAVVLSIGRRGLSTDAEDLSALLPPTQLAEAA